MDMAVAALAGGAGVPAAVVSGAQCAGPVCQTENLEGGFASQPVARSKGTLVTEPPIKGVTIPCSSSSFSGDPVLRRLRTDGVHSRVQPDGAWGLDRR